ncbi:hypothetical protein Tco_0450108 [Tanacetum coccineum]
MTFHDQSTSMEPRYSYPSMTFLEEDLIPHHCMGDNPLVITANIRNIHLIAEQKKELQPPTIPLVGFAGQKSWPLGIISLPLIMIDYRGHIRKTITVGFMIVRPPSLYNVILGCPAMKQLEEKPELMCNQISNKRDRSSEEEQFQNEENDEETIVINEAYPKQKVTIGKNLPRRLKQQLSKLLCSNIDIFA